MSCQFRTFRLFRAEGERSCCISSDRNEIKSEFLASNCNGSCLDAICCPLIGLCEFISLNTGASWLRMISSDRCWRLGPKFCAWRARNWFMSMIWSGGSSAAICFISTYGSSFMVIRVRSVLRLTTLSKFFWLRDWISKSWGSTPAAMFTMISS